MAQDETEGFIEWAGRLTVTLVMLGFVGQALMLKWVAGVLGIAVPPRKQLEETRT